MQEYNKRPRIVAATATTGNAADSGSEEAKTSVQQRYHPRHVVHPCHLSLQEVLAQSDVVVSAVPSASYKVKTEWLKDGCICLNVAADKNFEKDVRDKVGLFELGTDG